MVTIAFLVLAADAPETLRQFCADFQSPDYRFLVHLDAKRDVDSYQSRLGQWQNLRFLENRRKVYWAGFNMVEATLDLIAAALKHADASHLALLSDDTISLHGPGQLNDLLSAGSMCRIECWQVTKTHVFQARYERYFFLDSAFSNPRWVPTEDRAYTEADRGALERLDRLRAVGKVQLRQLYAGRQWWVLRREQARALLDLHHSDLRLQESFRFSAVSDEIYLQTLYRILYPAEKVGGNPMYDDFTRNPKPFVHTRGSGFPFHKKKDYLFVRKVSVLEGDFVTSLQAAWAQP